MSDTPLEDAIRDVPKNELLIKAGASQKDGKALTGTFEMEKGSVAGGVTGGYTDRSGWGIFGFFKKTFGRGK